MFELLDPGNLIDADLELDMGKKEFRRLRPRSGPHFHIEQGHLCGRPGEGDVEVIGPREDIQTVKVGGPAVTILRGELFL